MANIDWDQPATLWLFARGLERRRADFRGSLRDAVIQALAKPNPDGDGHIVELDDASAAWEGPEIAKLGQLLPSS